MYQKCLFKTFYGLYNFSNVLKTSKLQLQTRPTFTAIALPPKLRRGRQVHSHQALRTLELETLETQRFTSGREAGRGREGERKGERERERATQERDREGESEREGKREREGEREGERGGEREREREREREGGRERDT